MARRGENTRSFQAAVREAKRETGERREGERQTAK
jgi:hypothetical protein